MATKSTSMETGGGSIPVAEGPHRHRAPDCRAEASPTSPTAARDQPNFREQASIVGGLMTSTRARIAPLRASRGCSTACCLDRLVAVAVS
jgi:hypothetical protein